MLGAAMLLGASWRVWRSFSHMLWLDELYTTTLIDAPDLAHVWDGVIRGVDSNPPLYMSVAWLLTHAIALPPQWLLRSLNLVFLVAAGVLQYRIGRRLADPVSVAVGLIVVCAVDASPVYALLELRTYALYLLLTTATLWATLRVVDRPSTDRVAALALLGGLTALAHSFGGFYVAATIGAATLVTGSAGHRVRQKALAISAVPALVITIGWIGLSLPNQLAVATPYGWIVQPDAIALLKALTGSQPLTVVLLLALPVAGLRARLEPRRVRAQCMQRPDLAALYAALGAYAALTVAGWVGSQVITPFFRERYFTPNVTIGIMVLVPAVGFVHARVRSGLAAIMICVSLAAGLGGVASEPLQPVADRIPCRDADGRFLEDGIADGTLPVIVESPHAWFPRRTYAAHRQTLFPLDWDVVLLYPEKARNNAMDFHIMEILRDRDGGRGRLADELPSTAGILARYPAFLVLNETTRSWFDHLRATVPLSVDLLREGNGCRLWRVVQTHRADAG